MTKRNASLRGKVAAILGLGLGLMVVSGALAMTSIGQDMTATGVDPDARGNCRVKIRHLGSGVDGKLRVNVRRLDPRSTFEVVVDSVRIGTLTTNGHGSGRARFRTAPRTGDQFLGVDPRGKLLEVSDDDGDDVLEVEVDDDQDPTHVRCCVTEHEEEGEDEVECEDELTAEECAAAGGSDLGSGSCVADPCGGTGGGEVVRCCIPDHDDDGPECEQETAAECAERHGTNLGAGTCDPNPCGPISPPDEIRCCLPDGHHGDDGEGEHGDGENEGAECEQESALECDMRGGHNIGPGSCDGDPCAASPSGAFLEDGGILF